MLSPSSLKLTGQASHAIAPQRRDGHVGQKGTVYMVLVEACFVWKPIQVTFYFFCGSERAFADLSQ